jgi:hypothetical protein
MDRPAGGGGAPGCAAIPAPVPGGVHEGDLVIASAADIETARALSEVVGNVIIDSHYCGAVDLPNIVTVGGSVTLSGDAVAGNLLSNITALRMPNLTSIGDELFVYLTDSLVETDFRSLQTVGYRVYYMRNLGLRRIGLDALGQSSVSIAATPLAASCEIDAVCTQAGVPTCGSISGAQTNCTCETLCGRLEPVCP